MVKFIYDEKARKVCEITTVDLFYTVPVKSMVDILQNFVAFSEYMNFIKRVYCRPSIMEHPKGVFTAIENFYPGEMP